MVAIVVVLAMVSGACAKTSAPTSPTADDASILPPPPPAPLIVLLRRPGTASTAVTGLPVRLESRVMAERPVARLELWVDGELVEGRTVEDAETEVGAEWSWTPETGGLHAVLLRAGDVDGRTMQSSPTWVRVSGGPTDASASLPAPAAAAAGRLPGGWGAPAALLGPPPAPNVVVDEEECSAEITVAAVEGAAGIAVYAAPFGGGGFEAAGLLPAAGGTLTLPLAAGPVLVTAGAYDATVEVPSAPVVYPPNPCAGGSWTGDVDLAGGFLATDADVERAYLYVSTDGTTWGRVPADDQAFVDRGGDGRFDFSSALPAVQAGGSLVVEAWGRVNGGLRALGRGTYQAAKPSGSETVGGPVFALPQAGLDWVAGKKLDSVSLKYCKGGEDCDILIRAGELCGEHLLGEKPPNTKEDAKWVGMFIDMCTPVSPAKTFRWKPTLITGVTHGVLQVSTMPPPSSAALDFPGLVFSKPLTQVGGDFPFDLAEVLFPKISASSGPLTYQQVVSLVPVAGAVQGSTSATQAGGSATVSTGLALASPFGLGSTAPPVGAVEASPGPVPKPFSTTALNVLYLRVLPMNGVQPVDDATNPVSFTIVPVSPSWYEKWTPKVLGGVTMAVTSSLPPGMPNEKYGRCVRVTENPYGTKNPAPSSGLGFDQLYKAFEPAGVGKTLCAVYNPPDDDWWDVISDAVDFVTDVWDAFSDFYGSLQSAVVGGIVSLTGCKPADICKTVVGGLINIGLAAVGVPPTIPKWKDVVNGAKGDLKSFVMTAMASSGVDCGVATVACEALASELLDTTLDEIEKHVSAATVSSASSGDYYLYLASDIMVVPEPVSTVQPAVWKVTFTRNAADDPNDDLVEATSCRVWGSVQGHYPAHTWMDDAPPNQNKPVKHVNEPVNGLVMTGPSLEVDLTALSLGESRSITVVADTMNDWYPPGREDEYLQGVWTSPHTWVFFQQGATLDLNLGTDCSTSWTKTVLMDGTPATPQEYPYP